MMHDDSKLSQRRTMHNAQISMRDVHEIRSIMENVSTGDGAKAKYSTWLQFSSLDEIE